MNSKPKVKLIGEDGNAFSIIARVSRALKQNGQYESAKDFTTKAMSGSYDELLCLVDEYCEIEGEEEDDDEEDYDDENDD